MMSRDEYSAIEAFVQRYYFNPQKPNAIISIQPYAYPITFSDLASAAQDTKTVQVAANADFVLTNPRMIVTTAANGVIQSPLIDFLLTDTGSQEQLMADFIPVTSFFTQPQFAQGADALPYPRIISGRSGMLMQVVNVSDQLAAPVTYKKAKFEFCGVLVRGFE
jgi:hypothetical protein